MSVLHELRVFTHDVRNLQEYDERVRELENKMSAAHNQAAVMMNKAFGHLGGGSISGGWSGHAYLNLPSGRGKVMFSIGSQWHPKPGKMLLYINVEDRAFGDREEAETRAVRDCGKIISKMLPRLMKRYGKVEWATKVGMGRGKGTRRQLAVLIDQDKEEQALQAFKKAAVSIGKQCASMVKKGRYESIAPAMYELLERLSAESR